MENDKNSELAPCVESVAGGFVLASLAWFFLLLWTGSPMGWGLLLWSLIMGGAFSVVAWVPVAACLSGLRAGRR
jgi:hypothetical protein